jgi:hypothetical protein
VNRFTRSIAACSVLLIALPVLAQDTATTEISDALNAQMDTLVTFTEGARQLDTLSPVERRFPTREETIAYLESVYNAPESVAELERAQSFYVALGMLQPDEDLRALYLSLLGSQIAGFYNSETQVMNVIPLLGDDPGESLSFTEEIIFVHEYIHALQDQHFGLSFIDDEIFTNNPDRVIAALGLVEGDATLVMNAYAISVAETNPLAALSLLVEGAASGTLTLPPGIPQSLTRELLFPYEGGLTFVQALYDNGGWEAVNAAFDALPQTSEQVLHPEKYLDGELGLEITTAALNVNDSWREVWVTAIGEYYLRELLFSADVAQADVNRAAAGWDGDQVRIYVNDAGMTALSLTIAWDTTDDRDEFAQIYGEAVFGTALNGTPQLAETKLGFTCALMRDDRAEVYSAPEVDLLPSECAG